MKRRDRNRTGQSYSPKRNRWLEQTFSAELDEGRHQRHPAPAKGAMSRKQSESLQYGIRDGKLLNIKDVPSGLACGCLCPACGERLIARKGQEREHHFAHQSGNSCGHARETALHFAAKDILLKRGEIVLPAVKVDFPHNIPSRILEPERSYYIDRMFVEARLGNIIPDVVVEIGGHRLIVEIKVTHGIDEEKLRRIRDMGISAIEIDLSNAPRDLSHADLEELVVGGGEHKTWVHSERKLRWRNELTGRATKRIVSMGLGDGTTWGCPLSPEERGDPYRKEASYVWHCKNCKYALDVEGGEVLCLA